MLGQAPAPPASTQKQKIAMERTDIYVGLGANLGQPQKQIREAIRRLGEHPRIRVCGASGLYRNPPMGGLDQPDYINAVVRLATDMQPQQLLGEMQEIERQFGRTQTSEHWASRPLDLDLLLWGDECVEQEDLTVPHPGAHERLFVLLPLQELDPELQIPNRGLLASLLKLCPASPIDRIAASWQLPQEMRLIAVEGPIGVGKTTLCNRLAADFNGMLMLENYQSNPFLERFYADPHASALAAQVYFLVSRTGQMQRLTQEDLFRQPVFTDYISEKSDWFSRLSLTGDEYDLWLDLYTHMTASLPRPDLVIYLQAPLPQLLERIQLRGRSFERELKAEFLERLSLLMAEYFRSYPGTLLTVDTTYTNLSQGQQDYQSLLAALDGIREPGQYFLDPSQGATTLQEAEVALI